jgi:ribonuclease HII
MGRREPLDRFVLERDLLARGWRIIAGVDEAGRGPLAGPVVAAAVVFPAATIAEGLLGELAGLNDSKQLTPQLREQLFAALTSRPEVCLAVAHVEAAAIDRLNILQATHRAMNAALAQLSPPPEHVLVDGLSVPSLRFAQTAVVRGDSLSYSIAAASIVAKVTRDRLMVAYDRLYPGYGFARHKGYGTPEHLAALAKHGPCPLHRRSFAPLKPEQGELF